MSMKKQIQLKELTEEKYMQLAQEILMKGKLL